MIVAIAHYASPVFRRQTWALKGFLVSSGKPSGTLGICWEGMADPSASIFGLVVGADDHLLKYESHLREAENDIRRQARNALAREGRIATESEIRRWRDRQATLAKTEQAPNGAAMDTPDKRDQ